MSQVTERAEKVEVEMHKGAVDREFAKSLEDIIQEAWSKEGIKSIENTEAEKGNVEDKSKAINESTSQGDTSVPEATSGLPPAKVTEEAIEFN